jgi:hypothetical protein
MCGHGLAGQQGSYDGDRFFGARAARAQRVTERPEGRGRGAGGEGHDPRRVDKGAEGADLLGEEQGW